MDKTLQTDNIIQTIEFCNNMDKTLETDNIIQTIEFCNNMDKTLESKTTKLLLLDSLLKEKRMAVPGASVCLI